MIFACLFSMMPTTQAITLVEVAEQAKQLVPGITSIDDVEVPTDVLLKRTASSTYDAVGPISFTSDAVTVSEKFDYVTEIDMVNVKQAMVDLKTLVLTVVDDADKPSIEQEINDSYVTGEFEIKVKYPQANYVINPEVLSANNMAGFKATKNNVDVSADVFENIFQEDSRINDTTNNEITLKVKVRDDIGHEVTYAKLIADLCDKLSFECLENTITGYGTYTVEVSVTGKTIIHSNSSEIGDIEYNFVQIPENADPVNPSKTSATVKINRANNAGGVTKNTVTIVYGGDLADKKTSYNRGTLVETDNFVIPEREGFEFVGLYKDEALTQPADDEFIITTDVILYAKWRNVTGEKCTVTIVGGVEDLQYVCGKDEVVNKADLPVPEKPGYLLEGLFMDPEYTIPVDETLTVSTDMILYAKLVLVPLELEHPLITGYHFAYIIGDEDSEGRPQVRPEDNITRQEVATVFYRLLKDEVRIALETTENPFSDVTEADWSNLAVSTMANGGYIEGRGGYRDKFNICGVPQWKKDDISNMFWGGDFTTDSMMDNCLSKRGAKAAVQIAGEGSTVIINGGYFKAGVDENDNRMDCIYAGSNSDASDNPGKIIINGGKFEFTGNYSVDESEADYNIAKDGDRFLLNCADNDDSALITVNGGKFKNHVPGKENVGDGEVVLGTDKKVYNVNTGVEITEKHTGTEAVWYEVR